MYLKAHHRMYENLPIRWDRLNELPENGNVSNRIQRVLVQQRPATVPGAEEEEDEEDDQDEDQGQPVLEDGPDTSGATGAVAGNDDFVEDQVFIPQAGAPLNDYDTPNLQSMAFPTLFPVVLCQEGRRELRISLRPPQQVDVLGPEYRRTTSPQLAEARLSETVA